MEPPTPNRLMKTELDALRAHRDEVEGQAHLLRLAMKKLRESALMMDRRDQQAAAAEIQEMKARRAVLETEAAELSVKVSQMMRPPTCDVEPAAE